MSFSNNEEDIEKFFNFVQIDDEAFVTQTFKGGPITSGKVLVDNSEDLIEEANKHTAEGLICLSVNPRDSTDGGMDTVCNLNNIVVDIDVEDCVRKEGVSPQEWKDKAKHVVREVTKDLEDIGLSRNLLVDSGNGFHIYVGIDLEMPEEDWKESEVYDKLSELQNILEDNNLEKEVLVEYEDGDMVEELKTVIKVDTLTSDIARRMKIAGTHNVKPEIPEKNYRMAEILEIEEPDREENNQALMSIEVQEEEEIDTTSLNYDSSGSSLSDREKIEKARKFDDTLDDFLGMYEYGDEGRSGVDIRLAEKAVYYGIDVETMIKAGVTDKYQDNRDGQKYIERQRRDAEGMVTDSFDWSGQEKIDNVLDLENQKIDEEDTEEEFDLKYCDDHFTTMVRDYMRPEGIPQTPKGYEYATGLFLLGVATDRNYREHMRNQQPNVVISYLGKSNVGKSFPKQYANTILGNTFIGPETFKEREINAGTPAGLMKFDMNTFDMDDEDYDEDGEEMEKRYYLSEEATKFWSQMQNDEGMSTYLTDMIDHRGGRGNEVVKSTVSGKGNNGPRRPFLNMLAGIQVSNFENVFSSDSVKQGIVGRMFVVDNLGDFSQDLKPSEKKQPPFYDNKLIQQKEEIARRLSAIHFLGDIHNMWRINLSDEAIEMWDSWVMEIENREEVKSNDVYKSVIGKSEGKVLKTALLMQIGSEEFYDHVTDYIQALCKRKDVNCSNDEWKNVLDNGKRSGLEDEADRSDVGDLEISKEAMQAAIYYHSILFIPSMLQRVDEMMSEDSEERKVFDYMMRNAEPVEGYDGMVINKREFNQANYSLKLNKDLKSIKRSLMNMGYVADVNEETNTGIYEKLNDKPGRNAEYIFVKENKSKIEYPHRGEPEKIKTTAFLDF